MLKGPERLLNASRFDTDVFSSAKVFLARTCAREATCLVLDIHFGAMSGIGLRHRLAAMRSAVPVTFMTAFDDESTHEEAIEAGSAQALPGPLVDRGRSRPRHHGRKKCAHAERSASGGEIRP
jgi:FixJ family two-component response regulator